MKICRIQGGKESPPHGMFRGRQGQPCTRPGALEGRLGTYGVPGSVRPGVCAPCGVGAACRPSLACSGLTSVPALCSVWLALLCLLLPAGPLTPADEDLQVRGPRRGPWTGQARRGTLVPTSFEASQTVCFITAVF